MQRQLDDDQIARARALRAEGKSYDEIKSAIGADVESSSIRAYCGDVPVEGKLRTRVDKARRGRDGRMIRPFTEDEDAEIIAWVKDTGGATSPNIAAAFGTMAALAERIARKRHSVAARITTLKKHGKISG